MIKKLNTIKVSGGAKYAKVAERIKQFREDTTNGSIITTQIETLDGWIFTTKIIADKSDPNSKEATGQSIGKLGKDKAFEKLETISVGRALANLGYLASGDVASFEEMEDFKTYKNEKIMETVKGQLEKCKTREEVVKIYNENLGNGEDVMKLITDKGEEYKKS